MTSATSLLPYWSASDKCLSVVEVCAHEPLELFQFGRLRDEDVFGDWINIASDLQGFTDILDDGGVQLIDSREVVLGASAVEVILQRSTIFRLCLWRPQRFKAKRRDAFGVSVAVAAIQFDRWAKHLMNSNGVWSHNVPVCVLQDQVQVIVITQTSLQLCRELVRINIGQARNSVLSHDSIVCLI